jgi:hypothetical protein
MRLIDSPTLKRPTQRAGGARMTCRQINNLLWVAAGCLCGLAAIILAVALFVPVDLTLSSETVAPSGRHPAQRSVTMLPPLQSFNTVLNRPLRRPLTDPVVVTSASPQAIPPQLVHLTLVGTIGNSLAMLRMPDGQVLLKGVGDEIAGARVVGVRPGQVMLRFRNVPVHLTKAPDAAPNAIFPAAPNSP